ncbi:unnamed protein product [Caenorhabditis brenneri]
MHETDSENVQTKASSEIFFSEFGKNVPDDEEPTTENNRVIDLYDPVDAMSLNRERDRVVVSGIRGVLQIIKILNSKNSMAEKPAIIKDLDMRVYRKGKVNILYSAQNVKWNQLYDQYIATTSSNGSVVCWNVSRKNKSVYKSHERSATCLDWHATTPYILISGSRDCSVKSYDMRVKDTHQLCFTDRNCESIRDVAMCKAPGLDDYFFTGDDGGVLRLWDLRQTKRWVFQKVAHRSFVSTLAMNPHKRTMIATGGGRDKMVKIWDWNGPDLNRIAVVETTAPLGRVVWRPDKPFHLATCASVNETTVHVWDVRRPYLPYVTYDEHRDSVTDACWPSNDSDVFLTCGKDGVVVLHNIDSGHAPISFACDVAFDITPDGTIGLAVNSEIHAKNDAELEASIAKPTKDGKKAIRQMQYETFEKPVKSLVAFGVPEALTHSLPPTTFYKIAEKYVIGGLEIMQLCEKNSKIARKHGMEHVAQTWRLVEALCEQAKLQEEYARLSIEEKQRVIRAWAVRRKELAEEGRRWLANLNDLYKDEVKRQVTQRLESTQHVTAFLRFSSSEDSDEEDPESFNKIEEVDRMAPSFAQKKKKKRKKKGASDFYFGAGEANFKGGREEALHHNEFIGLRDEAYEIRDVEAEKKFFCKAKPQPTTSEEYEILKREFEQNEYEFQAWSPMIEIFRLLLYHAEQGDMQTCATITMVCGKRLLDAVDFYTVNGWITCYMEMLDSLELYNVIAKIRKYCTLESINSVSRENTLIQLAHSSCDALIVNGRCNKCEQVSRADCTVCRFAIVGMTYQCNVCGHCMHVDHAYEWFQHSTTCAFVGCPCTCGDNTWPDMERTFIGNDEIVRDHRKFEREDESEEDDEDEKPIDNRADASRLDTSSEESDGEDLEWSVANKKILEKFGELPSKNWDTPWAKFLVELHTTRTKMQGKKKKEEDDSKDSDDEDKPRGPSPKTQKESKLREAFMYDIQEECEQLKEIIPDSKASDKEEKPVMDVDRTELIYDYLFYSEDYDEDEGQFEEYEEQDELYPRTRLEIIEEEDETEGETDRESCFTLGVFPPDDIDPREKRITRHLLKVKCPSSLYGNDYIKSIAPIGFFRKSEKLKDVNYFDKELPENERVTSPKLTSAVKEFLENVKRQTFGDSSEGEMGDESDDDDREMRKLQYEEWRKDKVPTEIEEEKEVKEEKVKEKKKKKTNYAEKALKILSMTRDELKSKKKKKDKKRINKIYDSVFCGKEASSDISSDEFVLSSSLSSSDPSFLQSDISSPSTSSESSEGSSSDSSDSELLTPQSEDVAVKIDEGYEAESEDLSDGSASNDELSDEPALHQPTPQANGDLKPQNPPQKFALKRTKKVSKTGKVLEYFFEVDETNRPPSPPWIPNPCSSDSDSCPSSHSSPSPPPEPPKKEEEPVEKVEEGEYVPWYEQVSDDEDSRDPVPLSPLVPKKIDWEETSIPVIVEPITSCANPIFSRITGRPPRTRPISISGYERITVTNGHGSPSRTAGAAANPLFQCSSSLPTIIDSSQLPPEEEIQSDDVEEEVSPAVAEANAKYSDWGDRIKPMSQLLNEVSKINGSETEKTQKHPEKQPESSESELFSSEDEAPTMSAKKDEEPFFPACDDIPRKSKGHRHPWETEKQYQRRLLKEQQEEDADEAEREKIRQAEEEVRRKKEEEEREWAERLTKHTPIMQELARRKRRAQYRFKVPLPSCSRPTPLPSLKRVRFTEKELDENLRAALESLKPELYLSDDSEYKKFVREKKVCKACKAQDVRHTRQEKDYVKWMRHVADEGQIFFARSLTDSCSVFQLAYLDGYTTDVDRVKQTALHLTEFIKMFYFINWEEMLLPYNDLVLKEVYELWDEFHQRRPRVCRLHYRDYQFKFFASSIATKIKAHLSRSDPISVRRTILSYDWLHLKPCVTTLDDDLTTIDEMLDPAVKHNPNWSLEEKKAANQYWDMFGNVPLHMKTTNRIMLPPESEDLLEIVDDSNYFTKKMIKNAIYNSRKYDIRLQYTTRKKKPDLFYVQDRSRKILNREWQMRLDRMINETRHVDLSTSSFHLNPQNKLIYAADPKHPFPVCQFDMGKHLVTVQPMVSKRYEALKSRLRRKFQFRRGTKCHGVSKHIELTTDKIRKLPSYKKFEPKLQKAEDFNKMLSKHLKVVDRVYPYSIRHLETIIEEDDETYLMVQMLEAQNAEEGNEYIDPESIFTMRRLTRSKEDRINQNQYYDEEYRRQLMNTEKLEKEKMRIVKKQWLPEFRKKLRIARKAIEVGRLMVEEDVRKWMSYQFELSFAKKQYRKNSWITRKQLLAATAPHWHEAIENLDFKDPAPPPVYSKPLPPLKRPEPNDGWNFNSSSDSGDYDSDDTDKEDDSFNDYETQPDLLAVAGELQVDLRAKIEEADQMADEEWEYSDDSSVSTWFDNDSDDILNRLINPDYVEENMMLKERMKGALGKKLWEIEKERATPEPVSDDELIDEREKEEEEEEEIQLKQEDMEIGDSDGVQRNQMTHVEEDVFTEKYLKREDRDEEMQQVRLFFKQFRIDHTYTSEPYKWSDELHDAFSCMHRNELRRVGNRLHRKIKDEYEKEADMDNVIADVIPLDESGLQYKLINFLLFREEDESFKESSAMADECNEFLRPIQRYEMFFGREGTYQLATFAEELLQLKDLRASFYCLMRHFGTNWKLPVKPVQKFIKLWWYNSRETLERFIFNFGEKVQTQKEIRRAVRKGCDTADEMGFNIRSIRQCFDKLEIASLVNDMIQEVHEYVEETTALCTDDSLTELDRQAFAVMDTLHFMQMKKGFPRDKHLVKRTDKTNRLDMYASSDSDTENPFEMMMLEAESRKLYLSPYKPRDRWKSSNSEEAETFSHRKMTPDQMEHYSKLYKEMKAKEAEKRRRRDEEAARGTLLRWEQVEREQRWLVEDMERKVHDYIMKQIAIKEIEGPGIEDPCVMYYGREGIHKTEVLDMCGLPLNLDNQMFYLEFEECQSGNTSISDASELAEVIEKGFDDIDDDAKSYSSVKHVLKHELHFQTEVERRRVPSCVIIFTPDQFFTDPCDDNQEYERWRRIIEASECPFSFNRLVMRERMLQRCRDEFQTALIEKYFEPNERIYQRFIEVFERCFILCVLDTELEAWDCRVISVDDHSAPASTRISYLRKKMVEDSQEHLKKWLEANIIDMEVYSRCPVILASHKDLTIKDANLISTIFMEEHIKDEWFTIRRDEGVKALDTIIRMPPPPAHKLPAYKIIFKPIYDAWIETWKFRNDQEGTQTLVIKKYDGVKEYIHKARMIVNYAHQYYRMKRFDSKMSKDPTEYQMIDRSDVPSASLFDSLDTAVSKFCNEDSPHLNDVDKQSVKDTLIQLATGKIPYFTANYLGGYDYSETNELNADDDENDDDRLPNMINPTTMDISPSLPGEEDVPEMEDVEEEYKWLRNLYNDSDFNRRRFMAVLLFEIAQRAVFKYAPHLADFERARKRFDYLLTLHGRQRPLLDMMLTKVRGTYFMPKDTNVFLYKQKLITFDELLDSAIHPKVWKDRKITLEDFRRQAPKDPYDLKAFIAWNGEDDDSDLESIADSDTSSSLSDSSGGSSSSSKTAKRIRRSLNRIRRELMITRLRSKPSNPEEAFALERRALGPKMWKRRRQINEMVELIADMDRNKIEEKIPAKKKELLNYINDLIVDNAETAHWSWGELKMRTKIGKIPPPIAMRPKHIRRIRKGLTAYKDPVEYDPKDPRTNGRRYFS